MEKIELEREKYKKILYESKDKIHIDKNKLEELLFDIDPFGRKFLVFSGAFLQKLDLSEVSFFNVEWDVENDSRYNIYREKNINFIDLSNTNAKIDFSSISNSIVLSNCNFANVDLSKSKYNLISKATNCIFSNCNIDYFDHIIYRKFINCDFSYNDFSNYEINSLDMYFGCNYSKTCIHIIHNLDDYLEEFRNNDNEEFIKYIKDKNTTSEDRQLLLNAFPIYLENNKNISQMIKDGYLDGCYINDKIIYTKEEHEEIKKTLKEYYKIK